MKPLSPIPVTISLAVHAAALVALAALVEFIPPAASPEQPPAPLAAVLITPPPPPLPPLTPTGELAPVAATAAPAVPAAPASPTAADALAALAGDPHAARDALAVRPRPKPAPIAAIPAPAPSPAPAASTAPRSAAEVLGSPFAASDAASGSSPRGSNPDGPGLGSSPRLGSATSTGPGGIARGATLAPGNATNIYPSKARRLRQQGVTLLFVTVEADGSASTVILARTSGSNLLDEAALAAARGWRFTPALNSAGHAVRATVTLPVEFILK